MSKKEVFPGDCKLRWVKYFNDVIEQDHRAIRGAACGAVLLLV